jgi:hypothetical protein
MPLDARYRAASQTHAGLILVSAKTFPQDRVFTAAITSALSALLDQPNQIQPGRVLLLPRRKLLRWTVCRLARSAASPSGKRRY